MVHASFMTDPELEKDPCPETLSLASFWHQGRNSVLLRCGLSSQEELLTLAERGNKLSNLVYGHDIIQSLKQL